MSQQFRNPNRRGKNDPPTPRFAPWPPSPRDKVLRESPGPGGPRIRCSRVTVIVACDVVRALVHKFPKIQRRLRFLTVCGSRVPSFRGDPPTVGRDPTVQDVAAGVTFGADQERKPAGRLYCWGAIPPLLLGGAPAPWTPPPPGQEAGRPPEPNLMPFRAGIIRGFVRRRACLRDEAGSTSNT